MGRLHSHRHGKSHSTRPITEVIPKWVTQNTAEIEGMIEKYAKRKPLPLPDVKYSCPFDGI